MEDDSKENANHLGEVGRIKTDKKPPYPSSLPEQPDEEDEDGRLDQRQDRAVQNLDGVCPNETLSGIMRRNLFRLYTNKIGFDD